MVPSTLKSGTRASRQRAVQTDVDGDRAVLHRRIDARDDAGDDAIAGVDGDGLADLNVFGLRFGDLDFGFEPRRVGDAREIGARRDLLADFDRDDLQHAGEPGAHLEVVALDAA